ncbi:hypothetical protein VVD49_01270 [Uliginosibacterium sp. H3]|uniref:Roadblock/LAMTOR2 domain-containing protein n=1 Tax=Uliginosibacterium silvisoli TaxID=3114758 RepID=A0ABU6JYD8_9RHOO|nr:hypothetical protein [Uliginosibacterium sp. H3]
MSLLASSRPESSRATTSIALAAHACQSLYVTPDTQLVCVAGALRLQTPAVWIGETLRACVERLHEGAQSVQTHAGWMTVSAGRSGAMLYVLAPMPLWSRVLAGLRGVLGRAVQARQGAAPIPNHLEKAAMQRH